MVLTDKHKDLLGTFVDLWLDRGADSVTFEMLKGLILKEIREREVALEKFNMRMRMMKNNP